jgi:putative SOS response-associated peptidase YedK
MCGRFTLTKTAREIAEAFSVSEPPSWQPKYNIAPTDWVLALVKDGSDHPWQLRYLRWGLIPPWAKDNKIASKLINARAETLTEKPSFRQALRSRRCLILADGFYEWREEVSGHRYPYYFHLEGRPIFAFAGLWETWQPKQGEVISSCTIITTPANDQMQPYHHRMPVLLGEEVYHDWLDPTNLNNS